MKLLTDQILDTYSYRCPLNCWKRFCFNWSNGDHIMLEISWILSGKYNTNSGISVICGLKQNAILSWLGFYAIRWPTTFAGALWDDVDSSLYKSSVKPRWSSCSHYFVGIICGNRANEIMNLVVHQAFRFVHTPPQPHPSRPTTVYGNSYLIHVIYFSKNNWRALRWVQLNVIAENHSFCQQHLVLRL
jgi:hypothetical protein